MTDIRDFIQSLAKMGSAAATARKFVCKEIGLSEDEVEISIHSDGSIHAIATPAAKVENITITLVLDGENE